jgi:pimeloyl-ACP methyl ester carboxylesterase
MRGNQAIKTVTANGTQIAYEVYGRNSDPVILLIHGLGAPLTAWPIAMVHKLIEDGFCVLLIDNRDSGKSQIFDHLKMPNVVWQFLKLKVGLPVTSPYLLTDMMRDVIGVLDALNIRSVHLVGASMGGMIAQLVAINTPNRVKSLTSIMSHTGNLKLPGPDQKVSEHLLKKPKIDSIQDLIMYHTKTWELIESPSYKTSKADRHEYVMDLMDRGISATGTTRQMLAIMAATSRVNDLAKLTMPCQIIHGTDDPLINMAGGKETAKSIPSAQLHLIKGMGHDFPKQLHYQICRLITEQAKDTENNL